MKRQTTDNAWTRRRFLRAAGIGASFGAMAPFVPSLLAEAQEVGGAPKRLLLFTHANGSLVDRWRSNGGGTAFTSGGALPALQGPILAPLDRHRDRLILLDGLDIRSATLDPIDDAGGTAMLAGHSGRTALWTGSRMIRNRDMPNEEHTRFYANAASIDHLIGADAGTRFRTLTLGTTSWLGRDSYSAWSFRGPSDPEVGIDDPRVAFDLLFSATVGTPSVANARRAERRSVLSVVRGELGRLRTELPTVDRARLDQHVESIADLERRVLASGTGVTCTAPARPDATSDNDQIWRLRLQAEIATVALACDLTRVVTLALGKEGGTPSWLPDGVDTHLASHESWGASGDAQRAALDIVTRQNRDVATEVATMLDRFTAGGETSLLHDSIVVWGTPMGWGGPHTNYNAPFVVASARSDIRTGFYHRWGWYELGVDNGTTPDYWRSQGGLPHNKLLVSLMHAMGKTDTTHVGDEGGGAGLDNWPLEELFT
jgi:hypothetical protein